MINVAYREIFELVGFGFSHEALKNMPISIRRFYFRLLQDRRRAEAGQSVQPQSENRSITFDPVKSNQ